jgi:hypothetical protein
MDVDPWGYFLGDGTQVAQTLSNLTYGDHLNHFIFENNQISNAMYLLLCVHIIAYFADIR